MGDSRDHKKAQIHLQLPGYQEAWTEVFSGVFVPMASLGHVSDLLYIHLIRKTILGKLLSSDH